MGLAGFSSGVPGLVSGGARSLRSSAPTMRNGNVRFLADELSRSERKASDKPSGDHRGEEFETPPVTKGRAGLLPPEETSQIWEFRRSPAGMGVSTT